MLKLSYLYLRVGCGHGLLGVRRRGIRLEQPWKKEGGRRNALCGIYAAAARAQC
jgi:hypothetical protein